MPCGLSGRLPAAAHTYFDKEISELSLAEAALLAASIQLPSQVNPLSNLEAARERAALVLRLMAEQGRIDEATRDEAVKGLAALEPKPLPSRAGSYFADWVLREVETLKGQSGGGLSATATPSCPSTAMSSSTALRPARSLGPSCRARGEAETPAAQITRPTVLKPPDSFNPCFSLR